MGIDMLDLYYRRIKYLALLALLIPVQAQATFTNLVSAYSAAANTTSSTSITTGTANATIPVGDVVVAYVAFDNLSTGDSETSDVSSVTDTQSNTWTKAIEYTNGNASAATGASVSIWYSVLTTEVTTSDTITFNFGSAVTAKACTGMRTTITGTGVSVDGTATLSNDGADAGSVTATGSDSGEHLWVRVSAIERKGPAWTITSGWSLMTAASTTGGGSPTSHMAARGEYDIATGTSSGASDPTSESGDHANVVFGLIETGGGATRRVIMVN